MAAKSAVCAVAKIRTYRAIIVVIVIAKNEEDPIKIEVARVATAFFKRLRAANSVISAGYNRADGPVNAHLRSRIYTNNRV